jgi:hypothetical protein
MKTTFQLWNTGTVIGTRDTIREAIAFAHAEIIKGTCASVEIYESNGSDEWLVRVVDLVEVETPCDICGGISEGNTCCDVFDEFAELTKVEPRISMHDLVYGGR